MKYKVRIKEYTSTIVEVEAPNKNLAEIRAELNYINKDFSGYCELVDRKYKLEVKTI